MKADIYRDLQYSIMYLFILLLSVDADVILLSKLGAPDVLALSRDPDNAARKGGTRNVCINTTSETTSVLQTQPTSALKQLF
ncbi:hypothetical protein JB92DRAFT_2919879 [Gautieria morchelliformis]|nr:hypothetical protein JB92DRAFT_2919879 [Gautieria morchelliformis]